MRGGDISERQFELAATVVRVVDELPKRALHAILVAPARGVRAR